MGRLSIGAATTFLALLPALAFSQTAPPATPNAYTASAKAQFDMIKVNLTKTAAKVSEELYSFQPTPQVRTLGQLIGHLADANFGICATAAGEKPPAGGPTGGYEKGAKTKAELSKGLTDAIAYCDKVIASLDDATGASPVSFFGMTMPKLSVIYFNIAHDNEHYGNLVTYMRLKGIVPPSSEGTR